MSQAIEHFLRELDERLAKGAREYGNRSFTRPLSRNEHEVREELLDQVGWVYVLWYEASRKNWPHETDYRTEQQMRAEFFAALRHRLLRNDRGRDVTKPATTAYACMTDLEVLAVDMFLFAEQVRRRLHPTVRALETARWMAPISGRRGGAAPSRSSD